MVSGSVSPLIPKPVPEIVAAVTTRFEVPLLVSVTVWELLCPTCMLLKFRAAGEIVRPGCVPVPLRETENGELEASLITVIIPVAAPVDVGAN